MKMKKWSPVERLKVINDLAILAQEKVRGGEGGVSNCIKRIRMVSVASAKFLEENKQHIFYEL